jgi:hypothetical protein
MKLGRDLTSPLWIYAKAVGFVLIGLSASVLIRTFHKKKPVFRT